MAGQGGRLYRPRIVDQQIVRDLRAMGAVVLEGPKASGKTASAQQHAASEVRLDVDPAAADLARLDPRLVLEGPAPRLIDEWQVEPSIWNAVRRAVDDRQAKGQFLLTGSAAPPPDARRHSGAGRMARVRMRPMSLWESGDSSGSVSFAALLAGEPARGHAEKTIAEYAALTCRGGWPEIIDSSESDAQRYVKNYLDYVYEYGILATDGARHDPIRLERFLQSYAQLTGHVTPLTTITSRAVGDDAPTDGRAGTLAWHTADAYRDAAQQLMLIEDVPAWSPQLRSRTRLGGLPKRHLVDPSLAASLLGADAARLLTDVATFGHLFESLVTRDVRIYAQEQDANVYHYRERDGALEADVIVERRDGSWLGIEIKLGSHAVDEAAATLLALAERRIARPPAALVVITTGEYAYRRPDGVDLVPLAALRP